MAIQTIASVRIHVERIIARIKKFKILKTEIPLNLHGTIKVIPLKLFYYQTFFETWPG